MMMGRRFERLKDGWVDVGLKVALLTVVVLSEDCLYLNVVRPSGYENQALPVAVWIHGMMPLSSFSLL